MPIDTRVTPSLHPDNVKNIDGYDESTRTYLAATETAFDTAYHDIIAVWDARAKAEKNPGWTPEQRIIQVSKMSERKLQGIAKSFDAARATLVNQIAYFEGKMNEPIEATTERRVSTEIRAHAKTLADGERIAFIQKAITDRDVVTVNALLGAPPYLSGLTAEMQTSFLRLYRERIDPETARKLKAVQGAKALIEEHSGKAFSEMQKAVGVPAETVRSMRAVHEAALKALEIT